MKLFGLKTCDTCRKARKALPGFEFVNVREDGVPAEVLQAAYTKFGQALVNTRSTTWRGLNETERACDPLALLSAHPTLMKRPLFEKDGALHLGWTKAVQSEFGVDPDA